MKLHLVITQVEIYAEQIIVIIDLSCILTQRNPWQSND